MTKGEGKKSGVNSELKGEIPSGKKLFSNGKTDARRNEKKDRGPPGGEKKVEHAFTSGGKCESGARADSRAGKEVLYRVE